MAEFNGIHCPCRTDNVRDMADGGAARRTQIENLAPRLDVNLLQASENTGGKLRSERIPYSVLN